MRDAAKKADLEVRQEIVAAATLATNLAGQRTSITDFEKRYALSPEACEAIQNELPNARVADEQFRFDASEFGALLRYRTVELDNGGVMSAPSSNFEKVFHRRIVNKGKGDVEFSTRGKIIDERLKKAQ
jgi:hypothetical protein